MLGRASSHNCSCASFEQVLSRSNKNPFNQGFLTGIATINVSFFFNDINSFAKQSLISIAILKNSLNSTNTFATIIILKVFLEFELEAFFFLNGKS